MDRVRNVDVEKMSIEEVDNLSLQIGEKMRQIADEASEKANRILNIYGMKCKIAISFDELTEKPKAKAKTGRKRKQANLKLEQSK